MNDQLDESFDECTDSFELPANLVAVVAAAKGGPVIGGAAAVLLHHGITEFGEAVCDGTISADALGPPASYVEMKMGYVPGFDPVPDFDLPPHPEAWDLSCTDATGQLGAPRDLSDVPSEFTDMHHGACFDGDWGSDSTDGGSGHED